MTADPIKVLLIEDNPGDVRLIREALAESKGSLFTLAWVTDLAQGLAHLAKEPVDAILLDLALPDSNGLATFTRVHHQAPQIPTILLTGLNDEMLAAETVRQGAQDFLLKGWVDGGLLARTIRFAIERKQAEEKLRESELRSRITFEQSPVGSVIVGLDKRFTKCNAAFCNFIGYAQDELIGKTIADVTYPADKELGMLDLRRLIEGKIETSTLQKRYLRKDGTIVWGEISISLVRDSNNRPLYFLPVIQDITARKQAEASLQVETANLDAIFESSPTAMFVLDETTKIVRVNVAAIALTGGSASDALQHRPGNALRCIHSSKDPRGCGYAPECPLCPVRNGIEALLANGGTLHGAELVLELIRDGAPQKVWMRIGAEPVMINGRRHLCVAMENITERKRIEEALRENELKYRALFETADDANLLFAEGVWVDCNAGALKVFNCTREQIIGAHPSNFSPPTQPDGRSSEEEAVKKIDLAFAGESQFFEWVHCRADGTFFDAEVHLNRLDLGGKPYIQAIVRDISERKRAEETIKEVGLLYRSLAENSPDLIARYDRQYRHLYVNPAAVKTGRYSLGEDYIGKTIHEAFVPEDGAAEWERHVQMVFESGQSIETDDAFQAPQGPQYFNTRFIPERDSSGAIVSVLSISRDITERKQAEVKLQESQAFYHSLVEQLPAGVFRKNLEGRYVFVSSWFCRFKGMTAEELLGKTSREVAGSEPAPQQSIGLASKYAAAGAEHHRLILQNGKPVEIDEEYTLADGRKQFIHAIKMPVMDPDEKIIGTQGILFDITERKRAEEALVLNAQRTQALLQLNQMTEATLQEITDFALEEAVQITKSAIGYLAFLNEDESVLTMHSWSKSAMAECAIQDKPIVYPVATTGLWGEAVRQRRAVFTNDYAAANPLKKGYPQGHVPLKRHMNVPVCDGSRIVIVAGVGNKNEEYNESDAEQLTLLMESMWRLMERKRTKEVLREANENLERRVLERTAELAKSNNLLDETGRLARVGGWEIDLITGKNYWSESTRIINEVEPGFDPNLDTAINFYAPESVPIITSLVDRLINLGEPFDTELELITAKQNRIWVRALGEAYRENGKIVKIGGVFQDITDRKLANEELKRQAVQLEAANQELEAFSYSVSHDLRAPLRHTSGYVELLAKHFRSELSEKGLHYLDSIADSTHQMGILIDDLLQFSRTGRAELRRTKLEMNGIVQEVVKSVSKDNPDRTIKWVVGKLPSISGDDATLRLVWVNLLSNAAKFTRTKKNASIEIGAKDEANEIIFFVKDNGVGFDMQYAQKLFGVFQRLHPVADFEGTGIGLANVRRIVMRHGGRTWAEAKLNQGATFYFSIPK